MQHLFKDAPDLLAEFKNFLPPDGSGHNFASEAIQDQPWDDSPDRRNAAPRRKKKVIEPPASGNSHAAPPMQNAKVPSGRVSYNLRSRVKLLKKNNIPFVYHT